jgi:hypothetical protein
MQSDKLVSAAVASTASHAVRGLPKRHIQCEDDGRSSANHRFLPAHLAARVGHPAMPLQYRPETRLSNAVRFRAVNRTPPRALRIGLFNPSTRYSSAADSVTNLVESDPLSFSRARYSPTRSRLPSPTR